MTADAARTVPSEKSSVLASIRRAVLGRLALGEVTSFRDDRVRFRGSGCAAGQVVRVLPARAQAQATATNHPAGGCEADLVSVDAEGVCEARLRRTTPGVMPGCSVVLVPAPAPAHDPSRYFNRRTDGFLAVHSPESAGVAAERATRMTGNAVGTAARRLQTGSPVIDVLHPWYTGTRMIVTGPAGAGKTSLIEALVETSHFTHVVVVMIGERGHEIDRMVRCLSNRSTPWTVVGASSASSIHERVAALDNGVALAQASAGSGREVLLLVDSLTRWARAMSLTTDAGSNSDDAGTSLRVIESLANTFESCLDGGSGRLTSVFTTLRPNARNDALTEECMALSDGHWILDRELAQRALHPAIEPLVSLSRTHDRGEDGDAETRATLMRVLAKWRAHGDAVELGLHQPRAGSDLDRIARNIGGLNHWLYARTHEDPGAAARRWAKVFADGAASP